MRDDDKRRSGAKRTDSPVRFSRAALEEARATPEDKRELGRRAQELAAEVVAVYDDVAHLPGEARESAERAKDAVDVHAAQAELTLDRAKFGVDRLAREALGELDLMLADPDVLADLCDSDGSLSAEQRDKLYDLAERAHSEAPVWITERLEHLAPALPFASIEPAVTARRVERARAEVERAERAATDAEAAAAECRAAGERARGRLLKARVGQGLGPAAFERIAADLAGDLEAAEEHAEMCRRSADVGMGAYVDALGEIDGKGRAERAGDVTGGNELEVGVGADLEVDDDEAADRSA